MEDRRIALLSRGEALEITVARDSGALRVEVRAAAARLSQRLRVLLHGCLVASLGTVDGGAQVERSATGAVRVALNARARGLALVSLDEVAAGCSGAGLGARTDAELQAEAVASPATGSLRAERIRVVAGGAEASLRLALDGGFERPSSTCSSTSPGSTSRASSRRRVSNCRRTTSARRRSPHT